MNTIFHVDFVPFAHDKSRHTESIKTKIFSEVQPNVIKFLEKMQGGDIIEYWKEGEKYIYEPMLTLIKTEDGRIMREVKKGNKSYLVVSKFNEKYKTDYNKTK